MTAGERLQQLAGLAGVSAATMLLAIGTGATSGEALVDYSGLPTATAEVHLLMDVAHGVAPPSGGAGGGGLLRQGKGYPAPEEFHAAVRRSRILQEDEDLIVLVSAFMRVIQ